MTNKKIKKLFFYFIWVGIIVSINTNSSLLHLKDYNFFQIINFLRALAPLVVFVILVFYLLINIKNSNFFKNRNNCLNIICICLLFYTAISILGLFVNNDQFFFERVWWNISYLNVIFYLYLVSYLFDYKFLKNIFLILLLFIICFYTSVAFLAVKESITLNLNSVYHSHLLSPNTFILDQGLPRTSGVARALFILFLLIISFLCFEKKYFYLNLFLCGLYTFLISLFDSRITSIFYFISLLIIFYSKFNFLKKIIIFLFLIMIFNSSLNIYNYILNIDSSSNNSSKRITNLAFKLFDGLKEQDTKSENQYELKSKGIDMDTTMDTTKIFSIKPFYCKSNSAINKFSSGRYCIWVDALNSAIKNYKVFFLGYGAQADRYNVNYSQGTQELSVSNIFLYVLTSGGSISVILILMIYIIFFMIFLRFFIFEKKKLCNESPILISSLLISSFILFRGITESSFAVFSLDYILFFISTFIIFSKEKNFLKKRIFIHVKK